MDANAHAKSKFITFAASFERKYPAYHLVCMFAFSPSASSYALLSIALFIYGVLRNLAFIAYRLNNSFSMSSKIASPITTPCSLSLSSCELYPITGAPIGYRARVAPFTNVCTSNAPSKKYPYIFLFSSLPISLTTASISSTNSPSPFGGKNTLTGVNGFTHTSK